MAKNITRHVQHIKSVDTTTITVDGQDVIVAKLPEWGDLKDGEIAVNYKDGYETISIRNNNNEVVAFPNINTVNTLIDEKAQDALTFDTTPTANSINPVTSGGIKTYVDNGDKIQTLTTYQSSTPLAVGDTHDQALSKLSKIIDDNEIVTARALTDLNDTKQDEIEDLDVIRTGAALGATALQTETQLSKGTTTGSGNAVTDISVDNHQITLTKGATFLTEHQDLSAYADGAEYDSTNHLIYLKHGNTRLANPINASDFIKDGMVDTVKVTEGNLVITFNTDSGKEDIKIPLTDIFDPSLYYTKKEIDEHELVTAAALTELHDTKADKIALNDLNTNKQDKLEFDDEPTEDSSNPVTSDGIKTYVDTAIGSLGNIVELNEPSVSTPLAVGDTYDQAFSKLTKIIRDNELTTASALTELYETKQELLTFDSTPTANSLNPVTSGGIKEYVDDATDDALVIECSGGFMEKVSDTNVLTITNGITAADVIEAYNDGKKIIIQHTYTGNSGDIDNGSLLYTVLGSVLTQENEGMIALIAFGFNVSTPFRSSFLANGSRYFLNAQHNETGSSSDDVLSVGCIFEEHPIIKIDEVNENVRLLLREELVQGYPFAPIFRYDSSDSTTASPTVAYLSDLESITSMAEITYSDLVTARNNNNLKPGTWYRITDYVTTTTQADTQSANHPFDVIVLATSTNTLSEEARAIQHSGDTYFANSKLNAWKVWYCLDNDTSRFAWADDSVDGTVVSINTDYLRDTSKDNDFDGYYGWTRPAHGDLSAVTRYTTTKNPQVGDTTFDAGKVSPVPLGEVVSVQTEGTGLPNGRGVIYRLIDEFNNDIKYDFKNIQFKRKLTDGQYDATNGTDTWCYTLNIWYNGMCQDASIVGNTLLNDEGYVTGVYENKFGYATAYNFYIEGVNTFAFALGDNVVLSFDDGGYYGIASNTIGDSFYNNTIGNSFCENTIGTNFNSNKIGSDFASNTIGNTFAVNIIGTEFSSNTIGNFVSNNTIGNSFNSNTIGDAFRSNTIGNNFQANTIGNNFTDNTIGIRNGNTITTINYVRYIRVEDGVQFVDITTRATTNNADWLQNITIAQGVSGTPSTRKVISHSTLNDTFRTTYQSANSNVVSV